MNVHQVQTKEPNNFTSSDITFDEAKEYDQESVALLEQVVSHFKERDKTVYVLGFSFGAFMAQDLIARYGKDVADGYLIAAGRLDIDAETWNAFSAGTYKQYEYNNNNGSYNIVDASVPSNFENNNIAKLAAGLGYKRYTDELANIDITKVTYFYGNRDEEVGFLSSAEIAFLESKGATVVLSEYVLNVNDGGHQDAIRYGEGRIKEVFNIE